MYTPPPPSPAESLSLGQASRRHFEDRRMARGRAGKWACSPLVPEIFEIFRAEVLGKKHSKRQ